MHAHGGCADDWLSKIFKHSKMDKTKFISFGRFKIVWKCAGHIPEGSHITDINPR